MFCLYIGFIKLANPDSDHFAGMLKTGSILYTINLNDGAYFRNLLLLDSFILAVWANCKIPKSTKGFPYASFGYTVLGISELDQDALQDSSMINWILAW